MNRTTEIHSNVSDVRERIERACGRIGRDPDGVTLVAISKRFPVDDIARAFDAGVRDFGENRVQELVDKMELWQARFPDRPITWHMVGHLQRNKVRSIVGNVPLFHSLDSMRLARAIDRVAGEADIVYPCLVQVNVSGEDSKFGFEEDDALEALAELEALQGLTIRGLMTLARPVEDPDEARPELAKLRRLFERGRSESAHELSVLSMGMTGDFEIAIEEGSTHVRLGTIIFGERPV